MNDCNDCGKKDEKNPSPFSGLLTLAVLVGLIVWLGSEPGRLWKIAMVMLGFGAVIFVHELGHFASAKAVGILVEAFSIGMGPVVIGVRRSVQGLRVRVLPTLLPGGKDGDGMLSFVIPIAKGKQGETEYRLSLIPFGGFVGMLGQDDTGADKTGDNPRSFGNKAIWQRAIVISAGVVMNVVVAVIVFVFVFAKGVELTPAVIGSVAQDSPAAQAGIRPGDEVTAVNGKADNIAWMDLALAGAFADPCQAVTLQVRRAGESELQEYHILPEMDELRGIKILGIMPETLLTIANVREKAELSKLEDLGFRIADQITAVNGREITNGYQFSELLYPASGVTSPEKLSITVSRDDPCGAGLISSDIDIEMKLIPAGPDAGSVFGMMPRVKIMTVADGLSAKAAGVLPGDVVVRMGDIDHPTITEMQKCCKDNEDKEVELVVLRDEQGVTVEKILHVAPTRPENGNWLVRMFSKAADPIIGVGLSFDRDNAIVGSIAEAAKGEAESRLTLPAGSTILSVGGKDVAGWMDVAEAVMAFQGKEMQVKYRISDDQVEHIVLVGIDTDTKNIGFAYRPDLKELYALPLQMLTRVFRGDSAWDSLRMGAAMTHGFIAQSYLTIKGMLTGVISPTMVSGPVGIFKMSYTIVAEKSITFYLYFMAMISVCIAVFNFLPLPVLDGGIIVMLIIEKIKGSPVPIKLQEVITYAGLILIVGFALFVTVNDILKIQDGVM